MDAKTLIANGSSILGIEFGSTRIKAVVIDEKGTPLASGSHEWENQLVDGIWTYSVDDIWSGLQDCYADLVKDIKDKYDTTVTSFASIGFSAMMHGYLAFNGEKLLVPFRTWRNTITEEAADKLTEAFNYNIPQRWSISHLYQAVLNKEEHVKDITFFTTLAGYVHWMLTGKKVLGVGDASGMFPIDPKTKNYDAKMIAKFNEIMAPYGFDWKIDTILPEVLVAGEEAGVLTKEGALKLDPTGTLKEGIKLAPPEGDAGTGMTATNSIKVRTGNVSAGTSIFSMVVLEEELKSVHKELDLVTTPSGNLVAMVHCNNCTSDLNAWVNLFAESLDAFGCKVDKNDVYGTLYRKALEGDTDCGGLISFNYFSGEPVTGFEEGRPLFVREQNAKFSLANFMRSNLYSSLATLKIGNDILNNEEKVKIDSMLGHGGLYKTPVVGQRVTAAALNTPISVMETAGEGGAWGMALLAAYVVYKASKDISLDDYLDDVIFGDNKGTKIEPVKEEVEGFNRYIEKYKEACAVERAAVENTK